MATDKNELTNNNQNETDNNQSLIENKTADVKYPDSVQCMNDNIWIICNSIDKCLSDEKPGIGVMRSCSEYLHKVLDMVKSMEKIPDEDICQINNDSDIDEIVHQMVSESECKLYIIDRSDLFNENPEKLLVLTAAIRQSKNIAIFRADKDDKIFQCFNPLMFVLKGSYHDRNKITEGNDEEESKEIQAENKDGESDDEVQTNETAETNDPDAVGHILYDEDLFNRRHPPIDEDALFVEPTKKHIFEIDNILKSIPMKFQRTTDDIETKLDNFFALFPNMRKEDTELIRSSFMFCHIHRRGIIKGIKPFLLVGTPGCGKTRFVTMFSSMIIGQKFTEFIACGASRGASYIMGVTPEYKGSEEGGVLRSLWESNQGCLTLNPIILLDEVDKCAFDNSRDNDLYGALCTILSDQCAEYFKDAFFDIPVHFWPLYFATANSIETMPEAILDRFHIIHFGEFTYEDMINVVIPQQYKELREELGESSLPEMLQPEDIALIYKICSGKARNIKMALQQILTKLYGANGNRKAVVSEEDLIYMSATGVSSQKRKIGF